MQGGKETKFCNITKLPNSRYYIQGDKKIMNQQATNRKTKFIGLIAGLIGILAIAVCFAIFASPSATIANAAQAEIESTLIENQLMDKPVFESGIDLSNLDLFNLDYDTIETLRAELANSVGLDHFESKMESEQEMFQPMSTSVNFRGHSAGLSNVELFTRTNTFATTNVNPNTMSSSFNMANRRPNAPAVTNTPQITVLTHGVGAARDWSNVVRRDAQGNPILNSNGNRILDFAYTSNSLYRQLYTQAGGAYIYWARMQSDNRNFVLADITNQRAQYNQNTRLYYINDASRHIIIVFDASTGRGSNDSTFYAFSFMLSRIIYDVARLNGGVLPQVNLIGHSRGGLTNLRFAMDRPDLVNSMVSISTPFFGSTSANLFGEWFMDGPSDALTDILSVTRQRYYGNRWNNNFDRLYSNINAVAIGAYQSIEFLNQSFIMDNSGTISTALAITLSPIIQLIAGHVAIGATNLAQVALTQLLQLLFPGSVVADVASLITLEIIPDFTKPPTWVPPFVRIVWTNDTLAHLSSQLGNTGAMTGVSNYRGFTRLRRFFDIGDGSVLTNVSQNSPPAPHNLSARDNSIITTTHSQLELGTFSLFRTSPVTGGVSVNGITHSFTMPANTELEIPEYIFGQRVVQIGASAFANQQNLSTITLPSTVTHISANAFNGTTRLENIAVVASNIHFFNQGGVLYQRGIPMQLVHVPTAFNGHITIPNGIIEIPDNAFANRNRITGVAFSTSITRIGAGAFRNTPNLTHISTGGVANTLPSRITTIYPDTFNNSGISELTIPNSVTSIGSNAFRGAGNLTRIYLTNSISYIGNRAFAGTSNLERIYTDNIQNRLPANLMHIGDNLFNTSGIRSIIIPSFRRVL